MEELLLKKRFEAESLLKEYLKIMYKGKTRHLPDEKEYKNILEDMKSKGYVFSENEQAYEPGYDATKTDKDNLQRFRREWRKVKKKH